MVSRPSSEEVQTLIDQLEDATQLKRRGKATKRQYQILDSDKQLISWKFNEWDYAKEKIPLPSNARGLFTLADEPKIAVRGYDKFFNINEVSITRWDWLSKNTRGPYYVTAKENGCIILVSGLEDGTIVVCSKHSTGSRDDATKNHAIAGQKFLEDQLKALGLTTKDLALKLYQLNATAVAEFCDDDFEEHIIEYTGKDAGLYLHGLNLNTPLFSTHPIQEVNEFADIWGFKKIEYFVKNNISDLQNSLTEYAKSGSYNNKEIEGFVIRCKRITSNGDQDYFFKFKFEEPYLMYRQWREVTKEYLLHKARSSIKFQKHKFITNRYLDFVIPLLDSDPKLSSDYQAGFRIIELRNRFLENYGKTGAEILNQELLEELEIMNAMKGLKIDENTKFVIIPVATIGCGKTTTAKTLVNLFESTWSLVSNDDIPNGKTAKHLFIKRALEELSTKRVVILDRNNHQYRERQQIFDDIAMFRDDYIPHNTNVQFVCMNFIPYDSDRNQIWENTTQRVFARGDNHQSIKASSEGFKVEGIMSGFVKRFQYVIPEKDPDSKFNLIIDLDSTGNKSSYLNAFKILECLHEHFPVLVNDIPSIKNVDDAFSSALEYKPTYTKTFGKTPDASKQKKEKISKNLRQQSESQCVKKKKSPVYFSIGVPNMKYISTEVKNLFEMKGSRADIDSLFYDQVSQGLLSEFHVTLAHCIQGKKGSDHEKSVWSKYVEIYQSDEIKDGKYLNYRGDIQLKEVIWNDKIVAVLAEIVKIYQNGTNTELSVHSANKFPHVTFSLLSSDVKPYYSNVLAEEASKFEGEGSFENGIKILKWNEKVSLKGLPILVNFR